MTREMDVAREEMKAMTKTYNHFSQITYRAQKAYYTDKRRNHYVYIHKTSQEHTEK